MKNILLKLKSKINSERRKELKKYVSYIPIIGSFINLDYLAIICGTDKFGKHFYTPHYHHHFKKFRYKKINLLEIGVGGYDNPKLGGGSLRMWKKYFPFGNIFSFDIFDKSQLQENRIKIFRGSQIDNTFLDKITTEIGPLDIIIDDGSHINEHVITSFKLLFPKLKDGGIYVVEDTQTSYWKEYGGNSENLNDNNTMLNFFKGLTDCVNYQEIENEKYQASYYDKNIISIHFYHNMVFIYKAKNNEGSSHLIANKKITVEEYNQ
jgi:hypothetical protein